MKEKVIIIGAGMGGLSAAIRLLLAGYQVEIYEKNQTPGGKMSQIQAQGYTFDVGPTIVMMPDLYRQPFELAGKNPDDYFRLKRLEPMYDAYFKDSPYRRYTITSDLVELMKMNEGLGQETALGFLQYLSEMYRRYQVAVESFITRPFRHAKDIYNPKMLREVLKLKTFDSAEAMMASFIPNKDLQQMMGFQTLYIGVSPKKGPSLYNMIPMIELLYGVWFIEGGIFAYARALERLFLELGGQLHYGQEVQEILIEQGQAKGIALADTYVSADIVISNADFPYTMQQLIQDQKAKGKYSPAKIESMDYSCSCLVFYWGVKGTYPELKTHNFVICPDLSTNLDQIFDGSLIEDPSLYLHIPSMADPSLAPEGHSSFYVLMPVSELGTGRYDWTPQVIDHYRQRALESLAPLAGLANLDQQIEFEQVYTPHDFQQAFNAYRGATFGLQPTLKQSNHWRPQSKSLDCDNLYFTGSSTHPGAGVPIALEGGKICADEVRRDKEEDFK
ncbi:phytoene desaturase family protein [Abiotrophia defectiva]|jgi:phytoene desaturase|uniref:phytoene desaturase family protein n=1 Tax=Abiotrophia defectiva TaxID=46125 RepID=UPI0028D357AB|nr:phytoene desaturase family protein [Abiotrophia defectiva]